MRRRPFNNSTDRWALWRPFVIAHDGVPYLSRRIVIRTPFGSIYHHRIHRPDQDRHLHNHPWTFVSIVLSGGYTEVSQKRHQPNRTSRHARRFNVKRYGVDYHRIAHVHPNTRTLVFCGPRRGGWGFLTKSGHTPWREYLGEE